MQALLLRGTEDPQLKQHVFSTRSDNTQKYTHQDFQNELVDLMSEQVLSKLMLDIKKSLSYSIIANEYNDISNKEQLSLCIRWVHPETFEVFENFVGFYQIRDIKSDTIVEAIKDILLWLQLDFKNLRGQTYDGASNMLGKKSGVAAQLKSIQPKAKETHCHRHSLNLSVKDVTQESKILKDTMGTVGEMYSHEIFSKARKPTWRNPE